MGICLLEDYVGIAELYLIVLGGNIRLGQYIQKNGFSISLNYCDVGPNLLHGQ